MMNIAFKRTVALWTQILVQFAIVGRASCVTDKHLPTRKDIAFPTNRNSCFLDGTPVCLQVSWRSWKWRPKKHKKRPCQIRIFANPNDLTFCPVHWLMFCWSLDEEVGPDDPMMPFPCGATHTGCLSTIFEALDLECSSHSIRRSAAQWAVRCSADLNIVRNVGCWKTIQILLICLAEGKKKAEQATLDSEDGSDPVFAFWAFNFLSMVDTMDGIIMSQTISF